MLQVELLELISELDFRIIAYTVSNCRTLSAGDHHFCGVTVILTVRNRALYIWLMNGVFGNNKYCVCIYVGSRCAAEGVY